MLNQPLFGIAPESLNAIDVDFTRGKELLMINLQMPVAAKHQRVIASEFICVNDGSSSNRFDSEAQKSLCADITNGLDL